MSDTDPWCHEHNQPATRERYTDILPVAVDDDGFCWKVELHCSECAS